MKAYNQKIKKKDNQSVSKAAPFVPKKGKAAFPMVDNRPNTVAQKRSKGQPILQLVDNRPLALAQMNVKKGADSASGGVVQRVSIEEDIEALKGVKDKSDDPLLTKILKEVLGTIRLPTTKAKHGPSSQTSHMGPIGTHGVDRSHEVVIDPAHYPDDKFRQSILLHETIHASADTKYGFNAAENESAFNVVHSEIGGKSGIEQYHSQVPVLLEILFSLKGKVEKDRVLLGGALADHMISRIDRALGAPMQEFDTVISELYYYLSVNHNEIKSGGALHELKRSANAAYNARNKGKTVKDSYKSELPRLNVQKHRRNYQDSIQGFRYFPTNTALRAKFDLTKTQAKTALATAHETNLNKVYKQYLMRLMQVQLESYGKQAEAIALANGLNPKNTKLTYLNWRMEVRTIKAWLYEARQKLAKIWYFKGTMTTVIASLNTIIAAFSPLIVAHHNLEKYTPDNL